MEKPKFTHKCFLCVTMEWDKDRQVPVFVGYNVYSTEPWNLSNTGLLNSALYITESEESYHIAYERMLAVVQRMAELLPGQFWKTVWAWVDPSPEAHEKKLALFSALQEEQRKRRYQNRPHVLRVADFTLTPGPRGRSDGPWSGEEFRDDHLIPAMEEAINQGESLVVNLDGTEGYAASFLSEAFGGMVKKMNINLQTALSINFVCTDEPELIEEIRGYFREACLEGRTSW